MTLRPSMFQPLITATQTLPPDKDMSQRCYAVTLSHKNEWIVCPTEIVTLQPQDVGCSVTVEHCVPSVFVVPTVCDTASPIPSYFSRFSLRTLGSGRFFINSHY